jgi:putative glutamine amidotransferase
MKPLTRRLLLAILLGLATGLGGYFIGRSTTPPASGPARKPPLIGIASLSSENYIRAVRDAGGIPVVLPNTDGDTSRIDEYLEVLDGLLLPGGADIPPSEYGEQAHESVEPLDDERFRFEKALSKAWITRSKKPMLGICLGSQWINVSSGGNLVQDIPSEFQVVHRDTSHPVTLEPDSRLFRILGGEPLVVNSLHHQSVRDVGEGLRIVARSPDGIVEGVETTSPDRFLIGVQWHPEKLMPSDARQAKLLKAFVEAAGAN